MSVIQPHSLHHYKHQKEENSPLLSHNLLSIFLQLRQLLHTTRQTLTITITINLRPFPSRFLKFPSSILLALFNRLQRFNLRHMRQQSLPRGRSTRQISWYLPITSQRPRQDV